MAMDIWITRLEPLPFNSFVVIFNPFCHCIHRQKGLFLLLNLLNKLPKPLGRFCRFCTPVVIGMLVGPVFGVKFLWFFLMNPIAISFSLLSCFVILKSRCVEKYLLLRKEVLAFA